MLVRNDLISYKYLQQSTDLNVVPNVYDSGINQTHNNAFRAIQITPMEENKLFSYESSFAEVNLGVKKLKWIP